MITRRSLFASLAGLAAVPIVAKQVVIGMDFGTAPAVVGPCEFSIWFTPDYAATLDSLIEKARSNLSRPQRDKGAE